MINPELGNGNITEKADEIELKLQDLRISKDKLERMIESNELGSLVIEGYRDLLNGELEDSLELFDKVLEENKNKPEVWYGKGLITLLIGDFDAAIQFFEKSITLKPDFKDALYEKGVALHEKGRTKEALEYWQKAREKERSY
ncbi:MAG: tetratricopeptide repeat protein [Candidatus Thermoplasmatota archaeon]